MSSTPKSDEHVAGAYHYIKELEAEVARLRERLLESETDVSAWMRKCDEARAAAREIKRCYTDLSTACDPTTWKQRWPWLEDSDE